MTQPYFILKKQRPLSYDDNRNLTSDGVFSYSWDVEDRLIMIEHTSSETVHFRKEFRYDYLSRRVQEVYSEFTAGTWQEQYTRRFLYDGFTMVAELLVPPTGAPTVERNFVWGHEVAGGGIGALLLVSKHTGADAGAYYPGYDGRGNVTVLVDADTMAMAAGIEYGPWGDVVRATGAWRATPFLYNTKWSLDQGATAASSHWPIGLYDYGLRLYSPKMGRFLNRDPIGEAGGLNLYQAFGGDPINKTDYLGMNPINQLVLGDSTPVVLGNIAFGGGYSGRWDGLGYISTAGRGYIGEVNRGAVYPFATPPGIDNTTSEALNDIVHSLSNSDLSPTQNKSSSSSVDLEAASNSFTLGMGVRADLFNANRNRAWAELYMQHADVEAGIIGGNPFPPPASGILPKAVPAKPGAPVVGGAGAKGAPNVASGMSVPSAVVAGISLGNHRYTWRHQFEAGRGRAWVQRADGRWKSRSLIAAERGLDSASAARSARLAGIGRALGRFFVPVSVGLSMWDLTTSGFATRSVQKGLISSGFLLGGFALASNPVGLTLLGVAALSYGITDVFGGVDWALDRTEEGFESAVPDWWFVPSP